MLNRLSRCISSLDYDDYTGRIAIGKIERGTIARATGLLYAGAAAA